MGRRIESLFLNGQAGRLEAILEEPDETETAQAALVCHPHPQFGGTMHNKVVHRMARGFRRAGCVVLRFNFRGVNLSEGEYGEELGETEDARVALQLLRERYPALPLLVGGFSFGSRVALRLAASEPAVGRVLAAGFPTRWPDRNFVAHVTVPKFFVQSTRDQYAPRAEFEKFYPTVPEPKELQWIEADDHFFAGALDEFEAAAEQVGRGEQNPRVMPRVIDEPQFPPPAG